MYFLKFHNQFNITISILVYFINLMKKQIIIYFSVMIG